MVVGTEEIKFHKHMENGFLLFWFEVMCLPRRYRIEKIQNREWPRQQ